MSILERKMRGRCLGRRPKRIDRTTPTFRWLMDGITAPAGLAPAVPIIDHVSLWPMLGNDRYSNCVPCGAAHQVQAWTAANGHELLPDQECAVAAYAAATGFDPATGAHDDGTVILDYLQYWMTTGIPIYADGSIDKLDGFAVLDPQDIKSVQSAAKIFGGVMTGLGLPTDADAEFENGEDWTSLADPVDSLGRHGVTTLTITDDGPVCITWGKAQRMSWEWWKKYADEAYVPLRREWIGANGLSPSGMTMAKLDDRLTSIRGTLGVGAF